MKKQIACDAKPASGPRIRQRPKTNAGTLELVAPARSCLDFERVHATTNAEGNAAPTIWMQTYERSCLYTASIAFWLARIMLGLAIRSFRSGIVLLSDVKVVFRVSERLRRIAWSLLKTTRESSRDHLQR
jgi:hypothetical protein